MVAKATQYYQHKYICWMLNRKTEWKFMEKSFLFIQNYILRLIFSMFGDVFCFHFGVYSFIGCEPKFYCVCFGVLLLFFNTTCWYMNKAIETRFVMKNALKLNTDLDYYKCRNENPFSIQQTSAVIFALIWMNFLFGGNLFR